ncbi:hypothetical protein CEXT_348181 [Caerostris extrusa]|uniref:SOCS box domain-containing protein n=1 Tax=Caerostris extrusa TaxID=172846 RepID=A0AAV4RKQ2_CAEEX|nr:hypothetical protein CEXT_348181 [Caerostris extrusa]
MDVSKPNQTSYDEVAVLSESCVLNNRRKKLLRMKANVIALCIYNGRSPLHYSCKIGCVCCTEFLLERGSDVDIVQGGITPLHVACKHDKTKCAKLLIKHGANVNYLTSNKETPLHKACHKGSISCTELLLKMGADVHTRHSHVTPLHIACKYNNVECARTLLKYGSNINALCYNEETPLNYACYSGSVVSCLHDSVECAQILLLYGANVNAMDDSEETPLYNACIAGSAVCAEFLLLRGADVDTPQSSMNPLHAACNKDKVECAELLLKYGANINATDIWGRTPLIAACEFFSTSCVELLLKMGANTDTIVNSRTALHLASHGARLCKNAFGSSMNAATSIHSLVMILYVFLNKLPIDYLPSEETEFYELLIQSAAQPVPLMDLCRRKIRAAVGRHRLGSLDTLNLPENLLLYLKHKEE